ncbi:asparagine synthetase B [Sulfuriferula plumbiphila]|uniref:asparagine synthase (glutamine-hydrolyzing) n=1 Tax=Sulfuriferula plumbiphila TaxID=171865 RepID=A0A512L9M1_9PROT|nr:asparagine synthase (glutamine-hydrolyzing) [Sulfuriferula plumbiphila]BBP03674.1 asparagine synthetase B [Sulfuriferula plumbiphila]GEP31184.1 asparagine synthetase B [Sulfuriferula plumbiphila]
MCGIAGIYSVSAAVPQAALTQLAAALRHRGPDATGYHQTARLGLVHTRLSIIDLAGGNQPLYTRDRRLCVVANGEIYNHIELRATLEARGHVFSTHSDCETILHAYREYGDDFVRHLFGMFAFALYDVTRDRLLLARDRLGIKPLFIMADSAGVGFASEIKALLPAGAPAHIEPDALLQYFHSNFISGARTIVAGIEKVLPGELVEVRDGRITSRSRYWQLSDVEPLEISYAEAARRFDDLMATVVQQHLRADVPFGVFLSGGVDSSTLVALIRRYSDQPLHTYSVGFPGAAVNNELAAARRVAEQFHTGHTELALSERDLLAVLNDTIAVSGELMADYANLPTWLLARRASQDVKVVLSGEGGDEVFAGYGRYRAPRIRRLWQALQHPGSGGYRTRGLAKSVSVTDLFNGGDAERIARAPFIQAWREANPRWSDLVRMQYTDVATWLADDLLVKADRMMMAHGVEGRVPFLDHRVVEFGLALPDRLKVEGRTGKVFLRRWAEQFLPRDHLWSKKKGFTVPVREWLRGERMVQLGAACHGHAAFQAMRAAPLARLIGRQSRTGDETIFVWALLQYGLWHERFVQGGAGVLHDWVDAGTH